MAQHRTADIDTFESGMQLRRRNAGSWLLCMDRQRDQAGK
jgi:hypothetical protein